MWAMQAAAGTLLLLVGLSSLYHAAEGSTAAGVVSWTPPHHTRHLQSSCDTGSFPELKPVSAVLEPHRHCCTGCSKFNAAYSACAAGTSPHRTAVVLAWPHALCRPSWTLGQQAWSGLAQTIRCAGCCCGWRYCWGQRIHAAAGGPPQPGHPLQSRGSVFLARS